MASMVFIVTLLSIFFLKEINSLLSEEKNAPKQIPLWNTTITDRLKQDLLLNYDKFARPAQHTNVTNVRFGLEITHVQVNELKSTLIISGWTRLSWTDEKLKWDEKRYDGVSLINVAPIEIWQPDIVLYNSATATDVAMESMNILVYANGDVLWVPTSTYPILCNFNFRNWPFDTQTCTMIVGSWTYHGAHVDINHYGRDHQSMTDHMMVNSTEWVITETKASKSITFKECCKEPYPTLKITIKLQRNADAYRMLIAAPAFVINIIVLLSFWFSPKSGEKIILLGIAAWITLYYLIYFTEKISAFNKSNDVPLIVEFYTNSFIVIAFAFINAVIVITISKSPHPNPIPCVVKNILYGSGGSCLALSSYVNQAINRHKSNETANRSPLFKYQKDWILVALAIDRIFFVIYCIIFVILVSKYRA